MRMNRRNVLAGIGALTAGGGAIFGSGAFSQVEANRTVSIRTSNDASALLALSPNDSLTSSAVTTSNGTLQINLGDSTNGINIDARTTVGELNEDESGQPTGVSTEAFTIANNASNSVDVDVVVNLSSDQDGQNVSSSVFKLYTDVSDNGGSINGSDFDDLTDYTLSLPAGATASVVVQVDLTGKNTNDLDTSSKLIESVEITATQ